jgi:hypothetical protein
MSTQIETQKKRGRKPRVSEKQAIGARELIDARLVSARQIAVRLGVSQAAVYRALARLGATQRQHRAEQQQEQQRVEEALKALA